MLQHARTYLSPINKHEHGVIYNAVVGTHGLILKAKDKSITMECIAICIELHKKVSSMPLLVHNALFADRSSKYSLKGRNVIFWTPLMTKDTKE